jgi:hypothetical protein
VISVPDIIRRTIKKDEIQEGSFLFLACDGIWDVFTNEEITTLITEELKSESINLQEISERIIDQTIVKKNSKDNCSVIIVLFDEKLINKCIKISENLVEQSLQISELMKNYESNDLFSELNNIDDFFRKYVSLNKESMLWLNEIKKNENNNLFTSKKEQIYTLNKENKAIPGAFIDYFNRITKKMFELNNLFENNNFKAHVGYLEEEGIKTINDFKNTNMKILSLKGISFDLLKILDFVINNGFFNHKNYQIYNENNNLWFIRNFNEEVWNSLKKYSPEEIYDMEIEEFNTIFGLELGKKIFDKIHS